MVRDTCDIKLTSKEYRFTVILYDSIKITNTLSIISLMANFLTLSAHHERKFFTRVIKKKLSGFVFNSSGLTPKIELYYIGSAIIQGKSIYSSHIQGVSPKILLFQWSIYDCLFSLTPWITKNCKLEERNMVFPTIMTLNLLSEGFMTLNLKVYAHCPFFILLKLIVLILFM